MKIDSMFGKEWAYVPHFYSGFYVFQYSTSMAGAYYFADKLLAGDKTTLTNPSFDFFLDLRSVI